MKNARRPPVSCFRLSVEFCDEEERKMTLLKCNR